jgi:hypothetical protein
MENATQKSQMNVVVHKAAVSLMAGEALADYTSKLNDAGRAHVIQKLNLGNKDYIYSVEVFGDSVIFVVYYDMSAPNPPKVSTRYFSTDYTRDGEGKFTFGKLVEVKRVTRFEPVAGVAVTKSASGAAEPEVMDLPTAKRAWQPLWAGVL